MSTRMMTSYTGPGFIGLLTLAFIVLKLTGFIDWSWWWVLAPLGIVWIFSLVFFAFMLFVVLWRR